MRVLYCIDHLRADGAQRTLAELVEGLVGRGFAQAVLCLNHSYDPELADRLSKARAEVRFAGKAALACGWGLFSAWRWIRRERFDVAVTMLFFSDVIGRTLARAAGVPRIVSSVRARNTNYTSWQRWLVQRTMRWADVVVLNSAVVRGFAVAGEGARPERIVVIPNGVRVQALSSRSERASIRAEWEVSPEQSLLGSVGRLTRQKGFDLLLSAQAALGRPDVQLLLVGTGEEENRLRAQAAALGLQGRVHFAGYRRDVPRLLGALDLYVQPSRFEGMPNALLEAMAAGLPIVASAVDGICELITDGVQGWLVPAEDPAALAQAIGTALGNRTEAARRASAARLRATAQFSLEAMVTAWENVLRQERTTGP